MSSRDCASSGKKGTYLAACIGCATRVLVNECLALMLWLLECDGLMCGGVVLRSLMFRILMCRSLMCVRLINRGLLRHDPMVCCLARYSLM
jgi:hypothetical protein